MNDTSALDAPTELRTFLVADIRGYTRFTEQRGDEAAGRLAAKFAQLAKGSAEAHGGRVLELRGDEALAVFGSARQALRSALDLRQRCQAATEEDHSLPLNIGIGLDAGEAVPIEGGYRGAALNLAARLCGIAAPGQVLVGEGLVHLARKTEGLSFVELQSRTLKGYEEPVRVFEVLPEGAEAILLPSADGDQSFPIPPALPMVAREALQSLTSAQSRSAIEDSSRDLGDAITAAVNERLARKAREIRAMTEDARLSGARPAQRSSGPGIREMAGALLILAVIVIVVVVVLVAAHVL